MKYKIYTDLSILPPDVQCAYLLFPYLGLHCAYPMDRHEVHKFRFDELLKSKNQFYEIVSEVDADFSVLPYHWEEIRYHPELKAKALDFINSNNKSNSHTLVFYIQDDDDPLPVPEEKTIVVRTSLNRSKKQTNERVFPAICDDLLRHYFDSKIPLREKTDKPVIGFCGTTHKYRAKRWRKLAFFVGQSPQIDKMFKNHGVELFTHKGARVRMQSVFVVQRSKLITPNLVVRDEFWNGALRRRGTFVEDQLVTARNEFVNNIINSDYVLCARGTGNYSYRLYETMCCGRVPVFIDSDNELPFEKEIPWKQLCVNVKENEISNLDIKILDFHNQLSSKEFIELQQKNREIWLEWFSAQGFFKHLPQLVNAN